MAHYRIYFLGEDAHIKVAHDVDSHDDAAALLVAEELLSRTSYRSGEVWFGDKLIARIALNHAASAGPPPPEHTSPEKPRGDKIRRHSARSVSINVAEPQASRGQVTGRGARQCHEPADRDIASFPGPRLRIPPKRPISSICA